MSGDRRIEIVRHLSEEDLNQLLAEADDNIIVRRLTFIKNLYEGDTLEEAANHVGSSNLSEIVGMKEGSDSSR